MDTYTSKWTDTMVLNDTDVRRIFMSSTIYYNGPILTMENDHQVEAIFVENGCIQGVGTKDEVFKSKTDQTKVVDLQGKTLMPAFIDSHSHITSFANTLMVLALQGVTSFEAIQEAIVAYKDKKQLKKGDWIMGFGYDHNFLTEQAHPTKALLDAVLPENPIIITHESGHMGVLNSEALKALGIDSTTKDPEGGHIGRLDGSQEPNGYIEEKALMNAVMHIPRPSFHEVIQAMHEAQEIYLSYGITTCQDGYTKVEEFGLLDALAKQGLLKMDVISYVDLKDHESLLKNNPHYVNQYKNHYKIGGYKLFLDGSPQGRTAWMCEPYEQSEDGYKGYPIYQTDVLKPMIEKSLQQGIQLISHCNGDAAAEQYISVFTECVNEGQYEQTNRPVMIHAQLVRPDQLKRMVAIEMIPSFFMAHTYYWGDIHLENFGPRRANLISPAKSALDLGIKYTFHQDTPVIKPNMLETVWCAVNRMTKKGIVLGPQELLTPLQALKGVTIHAAHQYFEENQKGSIKVGKLADLVMLSDNPLTIDPMHIKDIQVLQTIKEGIVLYQA